MFEELFIATLVGLSFSNSWLCVLASFGVSATARTAGILFIAGRLIGLFILGIVIALSGFLIQIEPTYLIAIFGILSCVFGVLVIFKIRSDAHGMHSFKHTFKCFRKCARKNSFENKFGFLLGAFRGATPCLKIILIAPLLIAVELHVAILMIVVYACASSIYPIIGYLTSGLISKLCSTEHTKKFQTLAATILIGIGTFSILKVFISGVHE
jgi:hypothetical protein